MAPNDMDIDQDDSDLQPNTGDHTRTQDETYAARSIEGWIVLVTNVNEEAAEEDVMDFFGDYGPIKNLHMNLDRRSGFVKGYLLVEYATAEEARAAIDGANGKKFLEQTISVDFAFVRPPPSERKSGQQQGRGGARGGRSARARSRSPGQEDTRDDAE